MILKNWAPNSSLFFIS